MSMKYKGDLFGSCEQGQHAWRPVYGPDGWPTGSVFCKWCGASKGGSA